jgi:DNA-binding NarL/FixJ family response regulator
MTNEPAPGRVLIVDDEPLNVDYLEQELAGLGYTTESASTGVEALDKVAASPPDIVLLDVMMPELDGIATLHILKRDPATKFIPVVLMTALNAVEDRVRGIEAGADDFLSKPVDDRELLARIRTAIMRKRAIESTVRELHITRAHLDRFGRQEHDLAVVAITGRGRGAGAGDAEEAITPRRRDAIEEQLGAHCGVISEGETDYGLIIATFDGPDASHRVSAAVDAALAALRADQSREETKPRVDLGAAVTAGRVTVGATKIERHGAADWAWTADGPAVERVSRLVSAAPPDVVVMSEDLAAMLSDRYLLEPVGDRVYAVIGPSWGDDRTARPIPDRYMATVLVTDIVGSTSTLERYGDQAGGELLAAHERMTREELVLHGGEEINMVGDGFLASFTSPTRAIRCALVIVGRVRNLGLMIRAGIHTGELERIDGIPRGIAMHLATRIAARAAPGEVLVSATTRELAAGAGFVFVYRGEHRLKGVADPRRLFIAFEGRTADASRPATHPTETARAAAYPAGLTAREIDVLRLVAVGLSDAEVGEHLFVSVRTVNAHLRSIYRKAGVRSRAAATRFAEEHGLL